MKESANLKSARKNLRLVILESGVTAGILSTPVLVPFFRSIGLKQLQISEIQISFTLITLLLNIPMGYLADRLSRKWANVIGDFGHALILLAYSRINGYWSAVLCECLFGLSSSLTDGVDFGLLKHFVAKIARITQTSEQKLLVSKTARLVVVRQACTLFLMTLGGPIGAINLRLSIALSSVNHFLGAVVSLFIEDDSEKIIAVHRSPAKDMVRIANHAINNPLLRRRIIAYAIAREMTHGVIWVATPLFLKAGIPINIVSFVWAGNALMAIIGAHLAAKLSRHFSDTANLLLPLTFMTISMAVMALNLNIVTIWFYGFMGIIQGWTAATMTPMVQRYAKNCEQTSIMSLTKVVSQLLYIPTVWLIGYVADKKLSYALIAVIVIFLPLGLFSVNSLNKTT